MATVHDQPASLPAVPEPDVPRVRADGWVENPRVLGSTGFASFGGDISPAYDQLARYTDPIGGEGEGLGGQDAPTLQPQAALADTIASPSQP